MKTTLGICNAIVEVDLDKRGDFKTGMYSWDLHLNIFQKSDTAFVTSHRINCVTKEEVLALSDALRRIVEDN